MAVPIEVGTVFWISTDRGFALGIMTQKHVDRPRYGPLVWMADRFFDEPPRISDVEGVGWRWCVFFPLGTAVRRRVVEVVGHAEVPEALKAFPTLRTGGIKGVDHRRGIYENGDLTRPVRDATDHDRQLNVVQAVDDTALIDMLVSGWKPEDRS
jgi:hypothetical protein